MTVRKLDIRIDQTGNASAGIKGIAGSVGKIAKVGLVAGAAAVTGVALLTAGVVKLGSRLVGLGSDAEEMEGKFNVVFGESAPAATRELDEFGNAVGRNKYALMEMASSVQDTLVPMGFARDSAADMSLGLTKLAVDVGSFNNELETDVMENFNSALIGNHEAVKKYGIIITQATLDQELMRMGIEGGIKTATEQEKVQARLNLLYAGSSDALGDATRTAGSWANVMRSVRSMVAETATDMGKKLLPALTPLLVKFRDMAKRVLPIVAEWFAYLAEEILPLVISKAETLGSWIRDNLIPIVVSFYETAIKPAIANLMDWVAVFRDEALPIIMMVAGYVKDTLIPNIVAFYKDTIAPAIKAIREWALEMAVRAFPVIMLVAGYVRDTLIPAITTFYKDTVVPAIQAVKEWALEMAERVQPTIESIAAFVMEKLIPAIKTFYEDTVKPAIQSVKDWVAEFRERLEPVMERIRTLVEEKLKPALGRFREAWDNIVEVFGGATEKGDEAGESFDAIGAILWTLEAAANTAVTAIDLVSRVVLKATDIMKDLRDAIRWVIDRWNALKETAENFDLPDWLTPGSPTPLELGLRGIADAAGRVNLNMGLPAGAAGGVGAAGGAGITLNLTYAPAVSLANQYEAQEKLTPFILEALRKAGVPVV